MFNCFIRFMQSNKDNKKLFGEHYRNGYNKLWITNLRDYTP